MHRTLKCLEAELSGSLIGLAAGQTGNGPKLHPEKWCVEQIVGHLLLTYDSTVKGLEARLAKGRPTQAKTTLRQTFGQLYITKLGRFPAGRLAPEEVSPGPTLRRCSGEELIDCIQRELARMDAACAEASARFGTGPVLSHMVLGPMPVERWRTFHLVHGEHHVRQILALRKEYGC